MKILRVLALLLSLCLLLTSTACQSEQDALYSEAVSKQEGQSVAEPSVDPNDPATLASLRLSRERFSRLCPMTTSAGNRPLNVIIGSIHR